MSSFTEGLEYEFAGSYWNHNPIYVITKGFNYKVGSVESPILTVDIEPGFMTDMASIPFPFNLLFKPNGKWAKAAIIHDKLYSEDYAFLSKVVCDSIFLEAMLVLDVNVPSAYLLFLTVRIYQQFFNRSGKSNS